MAERDFEEAIRPIIDEAFLDQEIHDWSSWESSPSVQRLVRALGSQYAPVKDQAARDASGDPHHYALTLVLRMAWDMGFRAGQNFESRGYRIE